MNHKLCQLHKEFGKHHFVKLGEVISGYTVSHCACGLFICFEGGDEQAVAGLAKAVNKRAWARLLAGCAPEVQADWIEWRAIARRRRYNYESIAKYVLKKAGIDT